MKQYKNRTKIMKPPSTKLTLYYTKEQVINYIKASNVVEHKNRGDQLKYIADLAGVYLRTVYRYLKAYELEAHPDLFKGNPRGKYRRLTDEQIDEFVERIDRDGKIYTLYISKDYHNVRYLDLYEYLKLTRLGKNKISKLDVESMLDLVDHTLPQVTLDTYKELWKNQKLNKHIYKELGQHTYLIQRFKKILDYAINNPESYNANKYIVYENFYETLEQINANKL
jgi:transposase